MFPRKLYPGQSLTATEQNDLQRSVYQQGRVSGSGLNTAAFSPSGTIIRDYSQPDTYARISGAPTGAVYPWVEVAWTGSAWEDITNWPGGFGTVANGGAKELTGSTTVPTNTIVQLTPLPGGGGWGFTYSKPGVDVNSQNTDGTEIDATTTDLRFDKSTGAKVTQSAGVSTVTVLAAAESQVGAVTVGAQVLAGAKTFVPGTGGSTGVNIAGTTTPRTTSRTWSGGTASGSVFSEIYSTSFAANEIADNDYRLKFLPSGNTVGANGDRFTEVRFAQVNEEPNGPDTYVGLFGNPRNAFVAEDTFAVKRERAPGSGGGTYIVIGQDYAFNVVDASGNIITIYTYGGLVCQQIDTGSDLTLPYTSITGGPPATTTVSASYNSGTKDLTITVNGVSTTVNLT